MLKLLAVQVIGIVAPYQIVTLALHLDRRHPTWCHCRPYCWCCSGYNIYSTTGNCGSGLLSTSSQVSRIHLKVHHLDLQNYKKFYFNTKGCPRTLILLLRVRMYMVCEITKHKSTYMHHTPLFYNFTMIQQI